MLDSHVALAVGQDTQLQAAVAHYPFMKQSQPYSANNHPVDSAPFAVWLSRTLKTCHEDAVNEPIPVQLLDLLPPPHRDR